MDWGKRNRLNNVLAENGRCFFLPIDHGYFQGPTHCLEKPEQTIAPLLPYSEALFVTRGVLRACVPQDTRVPIILRASGCTSVVGPGLEDENLTTSIEEIIRLNAQAVGVSVFIGSEYENQTLGNLSNLVNECENFGIPVMAVTAVGKELGKLDARYLALCSRICAELGASVVKTYWCEDFDKVTGGCPVPVVIAGGPSCDTELEVMEFVYDGMQKGAIGVNLGRNVWQNPYPVAMVRALRAIIHDDAKPNEAMDMFEELKNVGEGK